MSNDQENQSHTTNPEISELPAEAQDFLTQLQKTSRELLDLGDNTLKQLGRDSDAPRVKPQREPGGREG